MPRLFSQSMILYCSFCMHTPAIYTPCTAVLSTGAEWHRG